MARAQPNPQQGSVGRRGPVAPGAAVERRIGMRRVEMRDDGALERDELGVGAGEAADLHDAGDLDLECLPLGR
jgi:hypothetical protein